MSSEGNEISHLIDRAPSDGGLIHLHPVSTSYCHNKYHLDGPQTVSADVVPSDQSPHNQVNNAYDLMGGYQRATEGTIISGLSGDYYNRYKNMTSHTL